MDESWLIPYADLLTLLLALFIVLFATSQVDAKKFEELKQSFNSALNGGTGFFENHTPAPSQDNVGVKTKDSSDSEIKKRKLSQAELDELEKRMQQEKRELENLKEKIDGYIEKNGLTTQLRTEMNDRELKLVISDNALFASGSATLRPESQQIAVTVGDLLGEYNQYEVVVAGHTDNVPIKTAQFDSNWDLSAARALSFMKVLLTNDKIDEKMLSAVGYAEFRPMDTNDTELGRSKNRRVEVSILRKFTELGSAGAAQ
nr:flagellar motor protein MotB [Paenibacillus turpanensis]